MFVKMDDINLKKKIWFATVRKLYSAVNDLIDILGKDMNEGRYNINKMEEKIQAYVNYLDDNREWKGLTKGENNDETRDLLFNKVQNDVSDIVILSTCVEDANKARNALIELLAVTSADVMNVLKSCIDDGGIVGKSTMYAKKKLIMNSIPFIYEKERTNNGVDLYYNLLDGKYQILHDGKIHKTKRGSSEKMQELDLQEDGKIENKENSVMEPMDQNVDEISPIKDVNDEANITGKVEKITEELDMGKQQLEQNISAENENENSEEGMEIGSDENAEMEDNEQLEEVAENNSEDNKENEVKTEDEVELSEEKIIEKLKEIQKMEGYEELKRCNDFELSFLAQKLLELPKAIDLLGKISSSEGDNGNSEELNSEFKSMLDELFEKFMVNPKYFLEGPRELGIKSDGKLKTFRRVIRPNFMGKLGLDQEERLDLKTISEYMAFICFMNNIKNSVDRARDKIKGKGRGVLSSLLEGKKGYEKNIIIQNRLIDLLREEMKTFEYSKNEKQRGKYLEKMKELKDKIELDFSSLISKDSNEKYSLNEEVKKAIKNLVDNEDKYYDIINGLMDLILPVYIKMGIFAKNNSYNPRDWFKYIDTSNFVGEGGSGGSVIKYPVVKYQINGKTIELKISELKNFGDSQTLLKRYYYDFKNVVLYAIYRTTKENDAGPYAVVLDEEVKNDTIMFTLVDVYSHGEIFNENSHGGDCLKNVVDKEDLEVSHYKDIDTQSDSGDVVDFTVIQKWDEKDDNEVSKENTTQGIEEGAKDETNATEEQNSEGGNHRVENEEKKGKIQKGGKKEKSENQVSKGREKARESVTIQDIRQFYVDDANRKELENLEKKNSKDQTNYAELREKYKIVISKPGCKNGILLKLGDIADIVCEKKVNKPYTEKGFKKIFLELSKLLGK